MPNANRAIWVSDWHMVSDDLEAGGVPQSVAGGMHPTDSSILAQQIAILNPQVVLDTGDCKDHYGTSSGETNEHDNYITYVRNSSSINWGTINADAGVVATKPILPGNHDQEYDSRDPVNDTSYISWNARFWGPPYHWTMSWAAPKVKFIALHTQIIHIVDPLPDGYEGWAKIDPTEVTWMSARVDEMPAGWTAILCSHHPLASEGAGPGGGVRSDTGGAALYAAMAARNTKIMGALSGHRHLAHNFVWSLDSITHICAPGVSYRLGDTLGRFNIIDFIPATNKLQFFERKAPLFTDAASYDSSTSDASLLEIQLPGAAPPPPAAASVLRPRREIYARFRT
jgi:3',5'-cyclic AMP phosphodiesterase CpdA